MGPARMANLVPAFMPNYTSRRSACSSAQRTASSGRSTRGISTADVKASCRPTTGVSDRKSTRLNSSHSQISYAVFCLKKKKDTNDQLKKEDHRGHDHAPRHAVNRQRGRELTLDT